MKGVLVLRYVQSLEACRNADLKLQMDLQVSRQREATFR